MKKIAELAALELLPCGSIDDRELKRLRNYAIDLMRCCGEVGRNAMWVWVPPTSHNIGSNGKKAMEHRELTEKEKFQLALNPHSSIADIERHNSVQERNKVVSTGHHRLDEDSDAASSDSDGSFMSQTSLVEVLFIHILFFSR